MSDVIDTSDEACAVVCMIVSNPQGVLRKDGDGWQKRVNDLIRALRDERNELKTQLASARKGAMEEAAKVADKMLWHKTYLMDITKPLRSATYYGDVAAAIRSLAKDAGQ